jgi:hypothetical protein
MEALGVTPWGLVAIGASIVTGVGFVIYGIGIGNGESAVLVGRQLTIKRLTSNDRWALLKITQQMRKIHGHDDKYSMLSEMESGVLASELMNEKCSLCTKRRCEKGDRI